MALKGQGNKQKGIRHDSLIESLRDLGGDFGKGLTEDFLKGLPEDFFAQTGLNSKNNVDTKQNQPFNLQEYENLKSSKTQIETVRHQETLIYSSKERELKSQVNTLYIEVKKLASATKNLSSEIKVAASQNLVDPGIYHLNFFEKLISFIRDITKQVGEASTWIAAAKGKSNKKGHYWGQFQKSGSKFLLSQERYMSTQAG